MFRAQATRIKTTLNAKPVQAFSRNYSAITATTDQATRIKTITLNAKPVNALDRNLLTELHKELTQIHASPNEISGVIFKSAFPKVLSAGLDLKTLVDDPAASLPESPSKEIMIKYKLHVYDYMNLFQDCVKLFVTLPKPPIAIVQGMAPAGGT
jgi:enoyl-CoA hydratase/carnithine racemase